MPEVLERVLGQRDVARGRQDLEPKREEQDEQDAEEEAGDAEAQQREHRAQVIQPPTPVQSCRHADGQRYGEGDDEAEERQLQGDGETQRQVQRDWPFGPKRAAQITLDRRRRPLPELPVDGQVQAEHPPQLGEPLRGHVALEPDEVRDHVSRHRPHQKEHDQRDSEERRHRKQAAAARVPEHEWREPYQRVPRQLMPTPSRSLCRQRRANDAPCWYEPPGRVTVETDRPQRRSRTWGFQGTVTRHSDAAIVRESQHISCLTGSRCTC